MIGKRERGADREPQTKVVKNRVTGGKKDTAKAIMELAPFSVHESPP